MTSCWGAVHTECKFLLLKMAVVKVKMAHFTELVSG